MFLAFEEIKKEKKRYGLIVLMIFLVSYLIFLLSSLAIGLQNENTQAIDSWGIQRVVLNKNANISMPQSILTNKDTTDTKIGKKESVIGQLPVVVKAAGRSSLTAQFLGVKKGQFIYQDQQLVAGRRAQKNDEVTVDETFKTVNHYRLGDQLELNISGQKYKIVGFVKGAKINMLPIIYGDLSVWQTARQTVPNVAFSGIVSKDRHYTYNHLDAKTYSVKTFVNKLTGYAIQKTTFTLMIAFLFLISMVIIAVFLYILTLQKLHNFAVMRAQGISTRTLVNAVISQSLLLTVTGVVLALLCMWLTVAILPAAVPMNFAPTIIISGSLGMLITGIIGGLIPVRSIIKIDPAQAI